MKSTYHLRKLVCGLCDSFSVVTVHYKDEALEGENINEKKYMSVLSFFLTERMNAVHFKEGTKHKITFKERQKRHDLRLLARIDGQKELYFQKSL